MPSVDVARRLTLVASIVASLAACGGDIAAPPAESYVESFDRLWLTVDREYANFPGKRVNWDSVYAVARPRAAALASDSAFIALAADVLGALHDVHVWLVAPNGSVRGTWTPATRANWTPRVLAQQRRAPGWIDDAPSIGHRVIGGIPYLVIQSWDARAPESAVVDRLLQRYRAAPALVVDVRMNAGGDEASALRVASRFADARRVVSHVQYRDPSRPNTYTPLAARTLSPSGGQRFARPVVLLTGRGAWSATESFISAMREFPNVTVVGDTSGGGSGSPSLFPLRGGWGFTLSRRIEFTARLERIEGRGVAPDVTIPFSSRALAGGRDESLESALAIARKLAGAQ